MNERTETPFQPGQSNLARVLESGGFAVTAELGPPKGGDAEVIRRKAKLLAGAADAVNITDNQTAVVRMSSIGAAVLAREAGLEPVVQMTCRDRNRLAIQADLLGAWALGLQNLLCLSGDHQTFGNHPGSKNVWDIDSIQLLEIMAKMRDQEIFACGEPIEGNPPKFFLGAAENPFGGPLEYRPFRLAKKVKAGAQFIQTQCIYNMPKFKEFMARLGDLGVLDKAYVLAGLSPLKGPAMAKYMRDSVPGMDVPDEVVDRMTAAGQGIEDKAARTKAFKEAGIQLCIEQIQEVRQIPGVAGVHLMAIEWEDAVRPIVEAAGLLPRPQPLPAGARA
ncbi:MAG: methylenetetrahydrofolate reductase [Deltaproteobacteria bacterium]|nr:methylenetetrahydrofolate reductase [Deltaproteobacteria bacterium]